MQACPLYRVGLFFSRWALGPQRHTSSIVLLPGVKAWGRRIPIRSPEWLPQGSAYSTAAYGDLFVSVPLRPRNPRILNLHRRGPVVRKM